ncbi:hypothetical protein CDIK_0179 [Cucumispora dikerogammari]|nr:hypothetical protein CDIK_0179 [Cucumispora dikerogammari]
MDIQTKLEKLAKLQKPNEIKKWDEIETILITKTTDKNNLFVPKDPLINYAFDIACNIRSDSLSDAHKAFVVDIGELENIEQLETSNIENRQKINKTKLEEIAREYF